MLSGVLLTALVACSEAGDAAPAIEPTVDIPTYDTIEDLSEACKDIGDGYPDAAEYAGDGPHPMVILVRDFQTETEANARMRLDWRLGNSDWPDSPLLTPESPAEVALLACGTSRPGDEQLNVCEYDRVALGGSFELPLHNQHYTFTVYELRTGREVSTFELEASASAPHMSCPTWLEDPGRTVYAKAQPFEIHDLLRDLVTEPAE